MVACINIELVDVKVVSSLEEGHRAVNRLTAVVLVRDAHKHEEATRHVDIAIFGGVGVRNSHTPQPGRLMSGLSRMRPSWHLNLSIF